MIRSCLPKVDLIAVLLNPNNPFFDNQSRDLNDASRALGLKIRIAGASNEREIAAAFATFEREQAGALLVFLNQGPKAQEREPRVVIDAGDGRGEAYGRLNGESCASMGRG